MSDERDPWQYLHDELLAIEQAMVRGLIRGVCIGVALLAAVLATVWFHR